MSHFLNCEVPKNANSRKNFISQVRPENPIFVVKSRYLKHSFDVIEEQTTLFYHLHDEDFENSPNEPKLIIGVLCFEKKTAKTKIVIF